MNDDQYHSFLLIRRSRSPDPIGVVPVRDPRRRPVPGRPLAPGAQVPHGGRGGEARPQPQELARGLLQQADLG